MKFNVKLSTFGICKKIRQEYNSFLLPQKYMPPFHHKFNIEKEAFDSYDNRFPPHEKEEILVPEIGAVELLTRWMEDRSTADSLMVSGAIEELRRAGQDGLANSCSNALDAHIKRNKLPPPGETRDFLRELFSE